MSAIEERIRKLLALADSRSENEAVAASGGERLVDRKVDPWRRMLAAAVARSAGGEIVWAPRWLRPRSGQDLRSLWHGRWDRELYGYLEAQLVVISAAGTAARRERRVHGRTWRNLFLLGAVARLGSASRRVARRPPRQERTAVRWSWSRSLSTARSSGDTLSLRARGIGRRWPAARTRPVGRRHRAGALLRGRRQPGQHRRGDAGGRKEARACPLGNR